MQSSNDPYSLLGQVSNTYFHTAKDWLVLRAGKDQSNYKRQWATYSCAF